MHTRLTAVGGDVWAERFALPSCDWETDPLNCRVFINLRSYYNYKFPYYNYKFPFILINFKIYNYKFPYKLTLQHKQEIDLNCQEYKMTDFVPDRGNVNSNEGSSFEDM